MNELDTIVAPATPVGRSALAMVRIDGPASGAILSALHAGLLPEERMACHIAICLDGETLDDCVVVRWAAPHSFTGNDLVELTLHGNPLIVERVITAAVRLGARIAEPGEFTERAVLNGKLDLVQAESINDLIAARTAVQAKLSLSNLEGMLSARARSVRERLLQVIARLEAALDFSEEGYEFISRNEARSALAEALGELRAMGDTYRRGRATQEGISAVILGRPNAGKSTLLNRLVGSERAIVTPIPGTTRDIVRETVEIGGLPVTLSDTAGLRESADAVEEIGIARARQAARTADFVIFLVDGVDGLTDEDQRELALVANKPVVLAWSKADLASPPQGELGVSGVSGEGIGQLLSHLDLLVRDQFAAPEQSPVIVNQRQRAAVEEAAGALEASLATLEAGAAEHLVVVDLYRAANALASLTGAITRGDILEEIFSKFCIGK